MRVSIVRWIGDIGYPGGKQFRIFSADGHFMLHTSLWLCFILSVIQLRDGSTVTWSVYRLCSDYSPGDNLPLLTGSWSCRLFWQMVNMASFLCLY